MTSLMTPASCWSGADKDLRFIQVQQDKADYIVGVTNSGSGAARGWITRSSLPTAWVSWVWLSLRIRKRIDPHDNCREVAFRDLDRACSDSSTEGLAVSRTGAVARRDAGLAVSGASSRTINLEKKGGATGNSFHYGAHRDVSGGNRGFKSLRPDQCLDDAVREANAKQPEFRR